MQIKSCCCCISVKTGATILGILCLVQAPLSIYLANYILFASYIAPAISFVWMCKEDMKASRKAFRRSPREMMPSMRRSLSTTGTRRIGSSRNSEATSKMSASAATTEKFGREPGTVGWRDRFAWLAARHRAGEINQDQRGGTSSLSQRRGLGDAGRPRRHICSGSACDGHNRSAKLPPRISGKTRHGHSRSR